MVDRAQLLIHAAIKVGQASGGDAVEPGVQSRKALRAQLCDWLLPDHDDDQELIT